MEAIDRTLQIRGLGRVDQIDRYNDDGFILMAAHSRMKGEIRDVALNEIRRKNFDSNLLLQYTGESANNGNKTTE
jgi:hypothetical protein